MTRFEESKTGSEGKHPSTVGSGMTSGRRVPLLEYFWRVVVVVLGMIVGALLSLFIGFATGWIQINC